MSQIAVVAIISWLAGITALIGGVLARYENITESVNKREIIHGIVAFGGGILVSAVAFALAPEGIKSLSPISLAITFFLGGISFCILDAFISKSGRSKAQFLAMMMDFIPEAIALGALFGHDHRTALLLALFIGVQNLPEGFNSYRESVASKMSKKSTLIMLFVVSLFGPVAGTIGYLFLQNHVVVTATIMSFAGGGILYLVFQDIAPQSKMRRHWTPPLGAVLGFIIGMLGKQLLR